MALWFVMAFVMHPSWFILPGFAGLRAKLEKLLGTVPTFAAQLLYSLQIEVLQTFQGTVWGFHQRAWISVGISQLGLFFLYLAWGFMLTLFLRLRQKQRLNFLILRFVFGGRLRCVFFEKLFIWPRSIIIEFIESGSTGIFSLFGRM